MKLCGTLVIVASIIALLAFTIAGDRLGIILGFAALLAGATMLTDKADVSAEWLRDHERRSSTVGVEQSRSTWPWTRN